MFGMVPFNRRNSGMARRGDFTDVKSIFDDFFSDAFIPGVFSGNHPMRADIRETEKEYVIEAEIPGVRKEDIKLDLRDDVLTIAVEHNEEINEERDKFIRKERRFGSYSRSFYVDNVANEAVTARYNNGVLTVTLPKQEGEKSRRHNIEIQ